MNKIDDSRLYWIDAIRSFACLCVITTHAPMPDGPIGATAVAVFNFFSAAGASILFFMISGALILYKPKPLVPFIKKRLSRIVFPMVFWTIISLLIEVFLHNMTWGAFWMHVINIPVAPQVGTYWFIYVILGIYLMTPILATWLENCSKKDLQIYLGIWAITLLLPYFKPLTIMVNFSQGYLYYYYGYLWFAVMGYYIRRYVNIRKFKLWHFAFLIVLILTPAILYLTPMAHSVIHNRMSLHMVALCVSYFIILKHLNYSIKVKKICYFFAQYSFGIYLVHSIIITNVLWPLMSDFQLYYAFQIPFTTIMTALLSFLLVKLFSFLPYSKYMVGV